MDRKHGKDNKDNKESINLGVARGPYFLRRTPFRRGAQHESGPAEPVGSMKEAPSGPPSEPNGKAPADEGSSAGDIEEVGSDAEPLPDIPKGSSNDGPSQDLKKPQDEDPDSKLGRRPNGGGSSSSKSLGRSSSKPQGGGPSDLDPWADEEDMERDFRLTSSSKDKSPSNAESSKDSLVQILLQALGEGRGGRRSSSMDDVQTNLLVSYRPFNPERDDIAHWISGFRRLVPEEATDQQVLKTLECKLPEQFSALLHHTYTEVKRAGGDWRKALRSFLNRVTGGESKFLKMRRLRSLSQKEGEPIRQFAIRTRNELRKAKGREPSEDEWREHVMGGAITATGMELDRIYNQNLVEPSLWDAIAMVEHWERQQAAQLHHPDPVRTTQSSDSGTEVLLTGVREVQAEEIACTWCSQRGHLESTCSREPRCAICFGKHPERNHHEAIKLGHHQPQTSPAIPSQGRGNGRWIDGRNGGFKNRNPQKNFGPNDQRNSSPGGRKNFDHRDQRSFTPRDQRRFGPGGQRDSDRREQAKPSFQKRAPKDPAMGKGRNEMKKRKRDEEDTGDEKRRVCYTCGHDGHMARECPSSEQKGQTKGGKAPQGRRVQVQVADPTLSPITTPLTERNSDRDEPQGKKPSELEMALEILLRNVKGKRDFNPFE